MKSVTLTVLPDGTMVRTAPAHIERGAIYQPKGRAWTTTHLTATLDELGPALVAWSPEDAARNHADACAAHNITEA